MITLFDKCADALQAIDDSAEMIKENYRSKSNYRSIPSEVKNIRDATSYIYGLCEEMSGQIDRDTPDSWETYIDFCLDNLPQGASLADRIKIEECLKNALEVI